MPAEPPSGRVPQKLTTIGFMDADGTIIQKAIGARQSVGTTLKLAQELCGEIDNEFVVVCKSVLEGAFTFS